MGFVFGFAIIAIDYAILFMQQRTSLPHGDDVRVPRFFATIAGGHRGMVRWKHFSMQMGMLVSAFAFGIAPYLIDDFEASYGFGILFIVFMATTLLLRLFRPRTISERTMSRDR